MWAAAHAHSIRSAAARHVIGQPKLASQPRAECQARAGKRERPPMLGTPSAPVHASNLFTHCLLIS